MGYLKGLTGKDIIVSPLTVHKTFSYSGTVPTTITKGQPVIFVADEDSGVDTEQYRFFKSIRQLYYGNYVNTTDGKIRNVNLPQYNSDGTVTGAVRNNIYENNISSIEELRYYDTSTASTREYYIFSIPRSQIGDYIKPGSFLSGVVSSEVITPIADDGEGNIYDSSNQWIGNIIYSAGLVIFTNENGRGFLNFTLSDPSWKSSYTIYETQYKCTVGASELNYSLNPSLLKENGLNHILESGSIEYQDFVTGSYFNPYATAVGLYNDDKELLAVGKLSQPLPLSKEVDTTILVNIDR